MSNVQNTGANSAPQVDPALVAGSQTVSPETESDAGGEEGSQEESAPTTKAETKKLSKLKLKVYGEEVEEELPFSIDENPEAVEYLTKQLQLSKAAQRAMHEKTSFENQVKQFFHGFKTDTKAALLQMGIDPKEFAAAVIEEEIKKAEMSPEERERQELQTKLKNLEEEAKRKEESYQQKELERLQQIEYQRIDNQITEALDSTDVPKTPYVVRKMAEYMLLGANNGIDLSPKDVLPIVREELLSDIKAIIASLGEDQAEEFIGKEVLTRFRKKNLAKAKATPTTPATVKASIKDIGTNSSNQKSKGDEKVDYKKFFGF